MSIYVMVGVEISRRRHAFQAIESDFIPLDDATTDTVDERFTNSQCETESTLQLQSRDACASHSRAGSSIATTTQSTATLSPNAIHRPTMPLRRTLSFRQYILMPLFFSLALLSVWIAPSTNRLGTFVNPHFSSYPMLLAVGISGSLRGFWNGLVFVTIGARSRQEREEHGRVLDRWGKLPRSEAQGRWKIDPLCGINVLIKSRTWDLME